MIRRLAILLLVCGGLGFFLQREQRRGSFDGWERRLLGLVQRVQGPIPEPPPVVLVELRRGDLPFESWPPAPLDYALIFECLVRHAPREVVVQPLLAWPGVESLDAATLAERIALLPRGVLACSLQRGLKGSVDLPHADPWWSVLAEASGDVSKVPVFAALSQVPIEELRAGKAMGFTRIEFGDGMTAVGDTLAVPMVARAGEELVPSLVLQALLSWQQVPPSEVGVQLGRRLAIGPSLEVPVDEAGRHILTTRLAPPLRRIDAGSLLLDLDRDARLMTERPAELATLRSLKGALVVLGETGENTPRFPVAGTGDDGWTEAEVIARSLVAALSGFHLREPPDRWQWAGWAGLVLLAAGLLASPRRWWFVFTLGGAVALVLGFVIAFLHGQWWIPPVPPLGLWVAASMVALLLPPSRSPVAAPPVIDPAPAAPTAPVAPVQLAATRPVVELPAESLPATAPQPVEPPDPELEAFASELAVDAVPLANTQTGGAEGGKVGGGEPGSRAVEPATEAVPVPPPESSGGQKSGKNRKKGHKSSRGRGPSGSGAPSGE